MQGQPQPHACSHPPQPIDMTTALFLSGIFLFLGTACLVFLFSNRPLPISNRANEWRLGPLPHTEAAQEIPRIIWSYWHAADVPDVVQRCADNWRKLNPDFQVHLLNASTLHQHLPDIPQKLTRLQAPKQSDWIRLALLDRHGGIWLDSSLFLTQPLDWVLQKQQQERVDFLGYYLDRYASHAQYPVIDSWFLAAPPTTAFIKEWLNIFTAEVVEKDTGRYLEKLKDSGRYEALAQRIGDPAYHTVHVVAQDVIQSAPESYPLLLLRAEDGPYAFHLQSAWKRKRLYARLLAHPRPKSMPPLIKLRGGERRKLSFYLKWRLFRRDSIVGCFLPATSTENGTGLAQLPPSPR